MKTIHKCVLNTTDEQEIRISEGAIILCVQEQYGMPTLWMEVDTDKPMESVKIRTYGTGHPMDDIPQTYIGTYQLLGGQLVFHVYQVDD